ncbi:MAG: hypothetical protein ACQEWD_07910 [Bacteroidota bacterium]
MNILVASIYSYNSYSRGIMPDVLQTQIDQNPGANIFYLTNSNTFDVCYFNIEKKPENCYLCKTGIKNSLSLIEGDFTHLKISDIAVEEDYARAEEFFKENSVIDFKLYYESFDVGAATLSTYISSTRDRELHHVERSFVKELAINALIIYFAVKRFLKEKDINIVYNFNGRQDYVRAIMRAAISQGIDCYNTERTRLHGNIDFYKNTFPHDPYTKFQLVENYWRESPLQENEKKRIGETFFLKQKAGESLVFPSYTGRMEKGNIPREFLNGNKNIVLYNSSDDEVIAFGKVFQYPLFDSQNQGLKYLTDLVGQKKKDCNLIIRMHPNLEEVKYDYVQQIKDLHQKFSNIFVVLPESSIDSYSLLEIADKVISFGSTMGLEANFRRKPVILLGKGFFYYADYAYKPENREEINSLLNSDLLPKDISDTLKVGFFLQKGGVKTKYYYEEKMGEGIYFKGKRIHFYTISQRIRAKVIQVVFRLFNIRLKF